MLARRRLRSSLLALAALLVPVAAFVPSLPARARPPSRAVPVDVETSEDYEWYILQCYVGNEVWCAATIEEILGKPEHVYHKEKIIYPGYVFCRLRMEQELWRVLTRVPKIANFVGIDAGMRNGIGEIVEGYKRAPDGAGQGDGGARARRPLRRRAAKASRGRRDDDDYGAADAGLDARRSRRSDRREAARGAEADAAQFRNRERSRWETLAAASERERSLLDGPDGSSYKVDAAFEQDDYENVDDDVAPVSADDEAFFDDLLGILDDPEGSEAAPAPAPAKKASHRDAETDDDALLRSLLSGGGGGGGGAADDSFADFLGDDAAFDALFDDEPEPAGDLPAPRAGDDDDDDELLAILGLGPELPAPLPDEPLDLFEPAPPPAAPPAGNDYAKQTVPELKALLKARGLKVGGKKADLVDRLAEADAVPN
ncbi:Transcription termination factor nusG [Aureococcus anophagefferens]|uniref:Transcription termination factor nusG n=1 Tax=Aureococcus anophagefferens TaxID=44056 RepID=A0ABR1GDC7_AURAN